MRQNWRTSSISYDKTAMPNYLKLTFCQQNDKANWKGETENWTLRLRREQNKFTCCAEPEQSRGITKFCLKSMVSATRVIITASDTKGQKEAEKGLKGKI